MLREDSGQDVAGTMGLGMREFGISQDALNFVVLRSVVRGPGVLLPGGSDSISLSRRALLVSEVQQDQGAPLVPLGVQAHKVLLEPQERKACR